jgi:hypothetical protein
MRLDIPTEHVKAIEAINALPKDAFGEMRSVLEKASPMPESDHMSKLVKERLPSITDSSSIVETLYTLYYIRELSGVRPDRFLDDLMDAVQDKLTLPKKELSSLRTKLGRLLAIEPLNVISKAARLQRDGERLYCVATILSDVRPVFREPAQRPVGAVLTHTLKIGYHKAKDHREFYVILDSEDLEALSKLVNRALAKDKSLRDLLSSVNLPNLAE